MQAHKQQSDLAPPYVTATNWAILDGHKGEVLFGKAENERVEIASMTKIMTCFIVIQICRKLKLNPAKTRLHVSRHSASVDGTSAKLKSGDVLSVWDLLHGLMLPSGNDAATVLAEHFGQYLYEVANQTSGKHGFGMIITSIKGNGREDQRINWEKRMLPPELSVN